MVVVGAHLDTISFAQSTEGVNGVKGKGNFKPKQLDPARRGPQTGA